MKRLVLIMGLLLLGSPVYAQEFQTFEQFNTDNQQVILPTDETPIPKPTIPTPSETGCEKDCPQECEDTCTPTKQPFCERHPKICHAWNKTKEFCHETLEVVQWAGAALFLIFLL